MQAPCFSPLGSTQTGQNRQIQFLKSMVFSAPSRTRGPGPTQAGVFKIATKPGSKMETKVKMLQSFSKIFKSTDSWFNACLVTINLWLFSKVSSDNFALFLNLFLFLFGGGILPVVEQTLGATTLPFSLTSLKHSLLCLFSPKVKNLYPGELPLTSLETLPIADMQYQKYSNSLSYSFQNSLTSFKWLVYLLPITLDTLVVYTGQWLRLENYMELYIWKCVFTHI